MSDYRVAVGSNIALASLTSISPQPRSEGVKATQRIFSISGSPHDYGLYTELVWDFLESPAQVYTVFGYFGLNGSAKSAGVTVYVPDDIYIYKRYNGRAIRPQPSWVNYFPRSVVILVRDLEEI